MNILFLSQIVPYPPHGGVLQRGYNLLREASRHARLHLLAFVHPDVLRTAEAVESSRVALTQICASVEFFPLWAKGGIVPKAAAIGSALVSTRPFGEIAHRSATYRQRVRDIVRSEPPSVIHVDTVALAQFVDPAWSIPKVLTHHNVESSLMARRARVQSNWLARRVLLREAAKLEEVERRASADFDVNIMMSDADAATLRASVPKARTIVVPNGVDTAYFTPVSDGADEQPSLIYTGGLNMFANRDAVLHFLSNIWPLIKQRSPQVRFVAIGQDPPRELREFALRDPNVVVTGFVDDIRPHVRRAAVYVVPLRVGGGTRLKVLDAMAMGKAIVSTSIGCEGLAVNDGEHLRKADTADEFAATVAGLLQDQPARRALGAAARALVEREYAWPISGERLMESYRAAVESRGLVQ